MIYQLLSRAKRDWHVVRIADGRTVFYGSKRECEEWLERNGHDSDV